MAEYGGNCGEARAVYARFSPLSDVHINLANKGACPIKIRFERGDRSLFVRTVHPGDQRDIYRDDVTRFTIDCLSVNCKGAECDIKFNLDVKPASRVKIPCSQEAATVTLSLSAKATVKVVNKGHCPVKVEFQRFERPALPAAGKMVVRKKMFVNPGTEKIKTVKDVNVIVMRCRDEQTDDDDLDETAKRCIFTYEVSFK